MDIKFPEKVKNIIDVYEKNGYRAYAVGGCVRDSLMGKMPSDWDITCSCSPEQTLKIFEAEGIRTIPTGIKHGTVSVLYGGEIFECTTHRVDGSYTDSRRPDFVEFTQRLEDDLSRRDFTVNAMAASPLGGICDKFGGLSDLERRMIRCVGDPTVRFTEDALRILRALRFATVLDFEIDPDTFSAAKELSHTLENISAERKTVEISKILCSDRANYGIKLLFCAEVMPHILPDARDYKGDILTQNSSFCTRLASLMWHSGARDLSKLRLSNAEHKAICTLISPIEFFDTDEGARRTLAKYGELSEDACTIQGKDTLLSLVQIQRSLGIPTTVKDLKIGGAELLAQHIPAHKIGVTLEHLLDCVLRDPTLNTPNKLLSLTKEFNA